MKTPQHLEPMKAQKKLAPLRFGQSAAVREWEAEQAKREENERLRDRFLFLVADDDRDALASDLEEMHSTGTHGYLCALDDWCIAADETHPEAAEQVRAILSALEARLQGLSGKLEKLLCIQ